MVEKRIGTEELPQKSHYDFIIFDFHGTITDHQLRLIRALHRSFSHIGIKLPKTTFQNALSRQTGIKTKDLIKQILGLDHPDLKKVLQLYDREMDDVYIPIPGMRRVLLQFQKQGIPMAVLTNGTQKTAIETVLDKWGLIMTVFTPSQMQMRKPEPKTIDYVLSHTFPSDPPARNRILFVGNETVDTQAAANSGLDTAIIARTHVPKIIQLIQPYPTYIVTDPKDLCSVVVGSFPRVNQQEMPISSSFWKS